MTGRQVGYPAPGDAPRLATAAGATPNYPHFWAPGPQDVMPVKPFTVKGQRCQWKFYWHLERVEGLGRREALKAIYGVLHDPLSWERTGIAFVRTMDPAKAHVRLAIVPRGGTVCGATAAGCYSWGGTGTPLAEVEAEYLKDPLLARIVLGMELCGHACLRILDLYNPVHQPYLGVMGTWAAARQLNGYPTDTEIAAAKTWLAGQTPAEYVHDD